MPTSWVVAKLGWRSFGLTFLVMGIVALVPGASTFIGVLLAWQAIQLVLGYEVTVLSRVIARRKVSADRLARAVALVQPRLEWLERLVRPLAGTTL